MKKAIMGRPRGTGKEPDRKFVAFTLKMPPDLLRRWKAASHSGEWSEAIRQLMEAELTRRSAVPTILCGACSKVPGTLPSWWEPEAEDIRVCAACDAAAKQDGRAGL